MYGFDADQMDALVQRGELEAALMREALPLEAPDVEAPTANGGAVAKRGGTKKGRNKAPKPTSIQARSRQALLDDGVVRINYVLSAATAGLLRSELLIRRDKAYAAIEKVRSTATSQGLTHCAARVARALVRNRRASQP